MLKVNCRVFMNCCIDSNPENLSCKSANESSDELSASASLATDVQVRAKLEEYERVIYQQQELLLQVIMAEILCICDTIIRNSK